MNAIANPHVGDLVCYVTQYTDPVYYPLGLVLRCSAKHKMSDVWWIDGITTCDWEDLEIINESHSI
jgi:hypothetical protein